MGCIYPDLKVNKALFNPESEQNIYKYSQPIINFMISQGLLYERITTANLFTQEILDVADKKTTIQ